LASPRGTTGWGTYPKKFAWKFDGEWYAKCPYRPDNSKETTKMALDQWEASIGPLGGLQGGGPIQKNSPGNLTPNDMSIVWVGLIFRKL
jgi:hypothetical protein